MNGLFHPQRVAFVGATEREGSVGAAITHNLFGSDFDGTIWPVNPHHDEIAGYKCYPAVDKLPDMPDLAIIATPLEPVAGIVDKLGRMGTRAAVVMTAGFELADDKRHERKASAVSKAARKHGLRIVGTDSLGTLLPQLGLNASFSTVQPVPGDIAFVSCSGVVAGALLDWATPRQIGFSCVISLGDMLDVDYADVLDYLTHDTDTQSILLYLERVGSARKFMSAARAAARVKPTIVVHPGRHGGKVGSFESERQVAVYSAAFRRAGMLQVDNIQSLFDAVETLPGRWPKVSQRIAVLANGLSAAILGADAVHDQGGELAPLSDEAKAAVASVGGRLVADKAAVALAPDAHGEAYSTALEALMRETEVSSAAVIHAPNAIISAEAVAASVARTIADKRWNVLLCWMGAATVEAARNLFAEQGLPSYTTPEEAVRAFMHIRNYRRNQEMLRETPLPAKGRSEEDKDGAHALLQAVLKEDRKSLREDEAAALLEFYRLPELRSVNLLPGTVPSVELRLAVHQDRNFGPVISIGRGGRAAGQVSNQAYGLPPLNSNLARELLLRCPEYEVIKASAVSPEEVEEVLCRVLVTLAQMAIDLPQLVSLELDPLWLVDDHLSTSKARVRIVEPEKGFSSRLAIRPYPQELEYEVALANGRDYLLRPIRPEDEPALRRGFELINDEDKRLRFFHSIKTLSHQVASRLSQIDYDREMSFVLVDQGKNGETRVHAEVRMSVEPDQRRAQFAIIVGRHLRGRGLGRLLIGRMLEYAESRGFEEVFGEVLHENKPMLGLAESAGFEIIEDGGEDVHTVLVRKRLRE